MYISASVALLLCEPPACEIRKTTKSRSFQGQLVLVFSGFSSESGATGLW